MILELSKGRQNNDQQGKQRHEETVTQNFNNVA